MLGLPYERPAALTADYLDVLDAAMDGTGPGRRRERALHDPQPDARHRRAAHVGAARRARPGDAAARRLAHRRHDPVAGRREGDRVAHRTAHHRRRHRGRPAGAAHRRRRARVPVPPRRGRRGEGPRRSGAQRGHRVAQLPAPARPGRRDRGVRHPGLRRRGDDPRPPRRRSRRPASPTSRCASCPSATAATSCSSRAAAPASSSPTWPPTDRPTISVEIAVVHSCLAPIKTADCRTRSDPDRVALADLQFGPS